jgi:hypothetical protein
VTQKRSVTRACDNFTGGVKYPHDNQLNYINMGIESNPSHPSDQEAAKMGGPTDFRRYDQSTWDKQAAWEEAHKDEMEAEMEKIRAAWSGKEPKEIRWQAMARIQARQEGQRLKESGRMDGLIVRAIEGYEERAASFGKNFGKWKSSDLSPAEMESLRSAIETRLISQPIDPDDRTKTTRDFLSDIVSRWVSDNKKKSE